MILNKIQTQKVKTYLHKSGIENQSVFNDLLDHICCSIEEQMDKGNTFNDSFTFALQQQPKIKLKEIERFTLKLLNMETSFSPKTSLLATIPFGMFGLAWILDMGINVPYSILSMIFLTSIILMYALLCIGWIKEFPRWSFPAIGFCLLFSIYFSYVTIPAIDSRPVGIWAWFPLLITLLVGLLFNHSLKPVRAIIGKIKDEPAMILLALYGFAPMFISFFTDEIHSLQMLPFCLICIAILCVGLYCFLICQKKWTRLLSLGLSGVLALMTIIISSTVYWR